MCMSGVQEEIRLRRQALQQENPTRKYDIDPALNYITRLEGGGYKIQFGIVFDDRRTRRSHADTFSRHSLPILRRFGNVTTYEKDGAIALETSMSLDSVQDKQKISDAIKSVQSDSFQFSQLVYLLVTDKGGNSKLIPFGDARIYKDLLPVATSATIPGTPTVPYRGRTTIEDVQTYHGPLSKTLRELVMTCLGYTNNLLGTISGTVFSQVAEGGLIAYERAVPPGIVEHEHWRYEASNGVWIKSEYSRGLLPELVDRRAAFSFYFDTKTKVSDPKNPQEKLKLQTKPVIEFDPPKEQVLFRDRATEKMISPLDAAGIIFKATKRVANDLGIPCTAWSSGSLGRSSNRLHFILDTQSILENLDGLLEGDLDFLWFAQPSQSLYMEPTDRKFQTIVNGMKYGLSFLAERLMLDDGIGVPAVYNSRDPKRSESVLVDYPVDSILPGSPKEIVRLDREKREILSRNYPTANLSAPVTITMCVPVVAEPFRTREEIFEGANIFSGLETFNQHPELVNHVKKKTDAYHLAKLFLKLYNYRKGFKEFLTTKQSTLD